jgi:hypothetical protein
MKPKKFEKKLVIKRVTITNLNHKEQLMIRGAGTVWTRGCDDRCDIHP